jgi:predicted  nucleic acid-binding Zn-ribbon protein
MTPEELQQIQAIIQTTVTAAVAPITTRLDSLESGQQQLTKQIAAVETKLEKTEQTLRSEIQTSEQKLMEKLNKIELLAADYLDGQVQTTKRRLDRVEKILNITP